MPHALHSCFGLKLASVCAYHKLHPCFSDIVIYEIFKYMTNKDMYFSDIVTYEIYDEYMNMYFSDSATYIFLACRLHIAHGSSLNHCILTCRSVFSDLYFQICIFKSVFSDFTCVRAFAFHLMNRS